MDGELSVGSKWLFCQSCSLGTAQLGTTTAGGCKVEGQTRVKGRRWEVIKN